MSNLEVASTAVLGFASLAAVDLSGPVSLVRTCFQLQPENSRTIKCISRFIPRPCTSIIQLYYAAKGPKLRREVTLAHEPQLGNADVRNRSKHSRIRLLFLFDPTGNGPRLQHWGPDLPKPGRQLSTRKRGAEALVTRVSPMEMQIILSDHQIHDPARTQTTWRRTLHGYACCSHVWASLS